MMIFFNGLHHLPPKPLLIISPFKNNHNHHRAKNGICNKMFILPDTKPREFKRDFHPANLQGYSSVCPNENEGLRFNTRNNYKPIVSSHPLK